jgi:hypothetical protein
VFFNMFFGGMDPHFPQNNNFQRRYEYRREPRAQQQPHWAASMFQYAMLFFLLISVFGSPLTSLFQSPPSVSLYRTGSYTYAQRSRVL